MHAHLPPRNVLKLSGYFAFLYLYHGVTAIRDMGDVDNTSVAAARSGIESGAFPGPRIFSCGPFVAGAQPIRWPNTLVIHEPAAAEAIAAQIKSDGHMCIKSYEDLTVPKLEALKVAARKHGLTLAGHVPTPLGYEEALVPDVQHFFGVPPPESLERDHILDRTAEWRAVDETRLDEIVRVTLEHGIVNTPTLVSTHQLLLYRNYQAARQSIPARLLPRLYADVAWHPSEGMAFWRGVEDYLDRIEDSSAKKQKLLLRLYQAGAKLQLGTDPQQPFVAPGWSLQEEMRVFETAGIPIEAIWRMATSQAAGTLGIADLGRLERGAPADLLVFERDPTRDLDALDSLLAVIAGGRLYRRADLDAALREYQNHYRTGIVDAVSIPATRMTLKKTFLRNY